jgi:hypothetical protein
MTDAERIIALEKYIGELHLKIEQARELIPFDIVNALSDILNDISCTSDGTWGGMRFLTGPIR